MTFHQYHFSPYQIYANSKTQNTGQCYLSSAWFWITIVVINEFSFRIRYRHSCESTEMKCEVYRVKTEPLTCWLASVLRKQGEVKIMKKLWCRVGVEITIHWAPKLISSPLKELMHKSWKKIWWSLTRKREEILSGQGLMLQTSASEH